VANAPDSNTNEEKVVEAQAKKPAAKKSAAKKPAAKATAGKKPSAKKPAAAKKESAKKAPAEKAVAETGTATEAKAPAAKPAGSKKPAVTVKVPHMKQVYRDDVISVLTREFGYGNPMQVPSIEKIILNIGLGEALDSNSAVGAATGDLQKITGQKPLENRARMSIANFKLREGSVVGTSVTLRGQRMWQFFDRFVNIALPRTRDFRGISRTAFDGRGNYSLGMRDQSTFPEIDYNEIDRMRGLQVTIVTTARTDEEGRRLLELLGMPFMHIDEPVATY
jgi:large subunit ribosomal protein L5